MTSRPGSSTPLTARDGEQGIIRRTKRGGALFGGCLDSRGNVLPGAPLRAPL